MQPPPSNPPTWTRAFELLHRLWSDQIRGASYDRAQKRHWNELLEILQHEAARAGYEFPRSTL